MWSVHVICETLEWPFLLIMIFPHEGVTCPLPLCPCGVGAISKFPCSLLQTADPRQEGPDMVLASVSGGSHCKEHKTVCELNF